MKLVTDRVAGPLIQLGSDRKHLRCFTVVYVNT